MDFSTTANLVLPPAQDQMRWAPIFLDVSLGGSTYNFGYDNKSKGNGLIPQSAIVDTTGANCAVLITWDTQGLAFVDQIRPGIKVIVPVPAVRDMEIKLTPVAGSATPTGTVRVDLLNFPEVPFRYPTDSGDADVTVVNTSTNPVPVSIPSDTAIVVNNFPASQPVTGASGALTDVSGTIAKASTSQVIQAAQTARKYILIQNNSSDDLWIDFGSAAVLSQPSLLLGPGSSYSAENMFVPNGSINIIGATAGQSYTAKVA